MSKSADERAQTRGLAVIVSLAIHALLLLVFVAAARWSERPHLGLRPGFDIVANAPADMDICLELPSAGHVAAAVVMPVPLVSTPRAPAPTPRAILPAHTSASSAITATMPAKNGAGAGQAVASSAPQPRVLRVPGHCRSVVYVIDQSSSMGLHGGLEAARKELLASLETLPAETTFQIVAYNRTVHPLLQQQTSSLVAATTASKARARELLSALATEGQTDHVNALKAALRLEPEMVYWLTDADDLGDPDVREVLHYNRRHIPICAVGVTSSARRVDNPPLQTLARMTGGTYAPLSTEP